MAANDSRYVLLPGDVSSARRKHSRAEKTRMQLSHQSPCASELSLPKPTSPTARAWHRDRLYFELAGIRKLSDCELGAGTGVTMQNKLCRRLMKNECNVESSFADNSTTSRSCPTADDGIDMLLAGDGSAENFGAPNFGRRLVHQQRGSRGPPHHTFLGLRGIKVASYGR
jgi:hypothetical protein